MHAPTGLEIRDLEDSALTNTSDYTTTLFSNDRYMKPGVDSVHVLKILKIVLLSLSRFFAFNALYA